MTSRSVNASLAVSIKWSLLAAVLFLLTILAGVSVTAQTRLAALGETVNQLGREHLSQVRQLGEISLAMTRIRLTAVRVALTSAADQRGDAEALLQRRLFEFDARLTEHQRAIAEDASAALLFQRFVARWKDYLAIQARLLDPALAEDRDAREQLINTATFAAFNAVVDASNDGVRLANLKADEAVASADRERAAFSLVLLLVNGLSIAVGLVTLAFVVREVSLPIRRMTEAMEAIAKGDLQTEIPYAERRNELGLMARALAIFRRSLLENERLSAATRTLSELSEWLQSAKSEPELYGMISDVLARLMPECRGSLYIYANSRDTLDLVTSWNGEERALAMHPDDCWSLRRGHPYRHGSSEVEFRCAHVGDDTAEDYCCIPILARGEMLGLIHLEHAHPAGETAAERKGRFADHQRLGVACAEHVSVAIANVKLREELRDQSVRDPLTGLNNRRYLLDAARREFERAERSGAPVALLSLDVDHFKQFNDNHGHDAGDAVLRAVAECLQGLGDEAIPCRPGGEEFTVVLPGLGLEGAALRAEELRRRIEAAAVRHAGGVLPRVTVSIGVAAHPGQGRAVADVMKAADEALYAAKRKGRNRVELASVRDAAREPGHNPDPVFGLVA